MTGQFPSWNMQNGSETSLGIKKKGPGVVAEETPGKIGLAWNWFTEAATGPIAALILALLLVVIGVVGGALQSGLTDTIPGCLVADYTKCSFDAPSVQVLSFYSLLVLFSVLFFAREIGLAAEADRLRDELAKERDEHHIQLRTMPSPESMTRFNSIYNILNKHLLSSKDELQQSAHDGRLEPIDHAIRLCLHAATVLAESVSRQDGIFAANIMYSFDSRPFENRDNPEFEQSRFIHPDGFGSAEEVLRVEKGLSFRLTSEAQIDPDPTLVDVIIPIPSVERSSKNRPL